MEDGDAGYTGSQGAEQAVREEAARVEGQVVCHTPGAKTRWLHHFSRAEVERVGENQWPAHTEAVNAANETEDQGTHQVEHRLSHGHASLSMFPGGPFVNE